MRVTFEANGRETQLELHDSWVVPRPGELFQWTFPETEGHRGLLPGIYCVDTVVHKMQRDLPWHYRLYLRPIPSLSSGSPL